jgi:hypothetical protein
MIYWPTRQFGFLSLMPRAGYRGTYYSKTKVDAVVTNVVAVTNELGAVIGTTNQIEELVRDGDAVWRSLPELGLETSFKAFGDLYHGPTGIEEDGTCGTSPSPTPTTRCASSPTSCPKSSGNSTRSTRSTSATMCGGHAQLPPDPRRGPPTT